MLFWIVTRVSKHRHERRLFASVVGHQFWKPELTHSLARRLSVGLGLRFYSNLSKRLRKHLVLSLRGVEVDPKDRRFQLLEVSPHSPALKSGLTYHVGSFGATHWQFLGLFIVGVGAGSLIDLYLRLLLVNSVHSLVVFLEFALVGTNSQALV